MRWIGELVSGRGDLYVILDECCVWAVRCVARGVAGE